MDIFQVYLDIWKLFAMYRRYIRVKSCELDDKEPSSILPSNLSEDFRQQLENAMVCQNRRHYNYRKYTFKEEEMGLGREMDGCGQFMKYSMFISNFIIFIGGVVVLGIGIWTLVDKSFINELLGTNLFVGSIYILIVTGAIIALIAFFGCLGAVKEIKCLLLMYFIIVFIIFIVMLVGGILGYVYREKARSTMEQEMQRTIRLYGEKQSIRDAWDETQENLHCCGIVGYSDWKNNIPESCCKYISGDRTNGKKFPCQSAPNPLSIYTEGCLNATERFVRDHAAIIGGAGIGVACIMLLGMIFSCALFKMIE